MVTGSGPKMGPPILGVVVTQRAEQFFMTVPVDPSGSSREMVDIPLELVGPAVPVEGGYSVTPARFYLCGRDRGAVVTRDERTGAMALFVPTTEALANLGLL